MSLSKPAPALCALYVQTPDESTRIEILDGNLSPQKLKDNWGSVSTKVAPGAYAVRFYQGQQFVEKLALVKSKTTPVIVRLEPHEQPKFASAAPVPNTSTTHEWQSYPARDLSKSAPLGPFAGQKGGSHLLLFSRNPFQSGDIPSGIGVHELNGNLLFDLDRGGHREVQQQWIGVHLNLDPGIYLLRRALPSGNFVEQTIFTRPGWQTQLFFMASEHAAAEKDVASTSILMAKPGVGFEFDRPDFRWTESALRALENKSNIPSSTNQGMLWQKFSNPMLGIYGGLLHLRRNKINSALIETVVKNLYKLVGPVPDVLAIGWGLVLRDPRVRGKKEFMKMLFDRSALSTPPMLYESWGYLLRADAAEPDLIPEDCLAARIGGSLLNTAPWLMWRGESAKAESPATVSRTTLPSMGVTVGSAEPKGFIDKLKSAFSDFASRFTLDLGLPKLRDLLTGSDEARYWLESKRFSALERRVACWLDPSLDPRLRAAIEKYPELGEKLRENARRFDKDSRALVTAMLTELHLTAAVALGAAWQIFVKLGVKPIIPRAVHLDAFVFSEKQGDEKVAAMLRGLAKIESRFHQPKWGRRINLLEFARLYYQGSPAQPEAKGLNEVAALLAGEGFVSGKSGRKPSVAEFEDEHRRLRKDALAALAELAKGELRDRLKPDWEKNAFPPRAAVREKLIPLIPLPPPSTAAPTTATAAPAAAPAKSAPAKKKRKG